MLPLAVLLYDIPPTFSHLIVILSINVHVEYTEIFRDCTGTAELSILILAFILKCLVFHFRPIYRYTCTTHDELPWHTAAVSSSFVHNIYGR